jgi:hypothetical protein
MISAILGIAARATCRKFPSSEFHVVVKAVTLGLYTGGSS